MKNVSKKLLSLLMVMALLVCAVPFQAMAADGNDVTVWFMTEDEDEIDTKVIEGATSVTANGLMSFCPKGYELVEAWKADKNGYPIGSEPVNPAQAFDVSEDLFFLIVVAEKSEDNEVTEAPTEAPPVEEITPPTSGKDEEEEITYTVYIDYTDGAEGEPARAYKMVDGQKFGDRLPANPQRGGMTFVRWVYAGTNKEVDADDRLDAKYADKDGNVYIDAEWNVKSLFLTLDENRQGEEYVNYGVTVKVGEKIYDKVYKYQPTRKGYVFMGWYLNGMKIVKDTVYDLPDSATAYAKWEKESDVPGVPNPNEKDGKVYLEIYLNGEKTLAKRVDITSYAADGKITRAEAEAVVKKYYSAKSGYKLSYEGLFDEESWYFYTRDPETDGEAEILVDLWTDHYVYVMVKNVKVTAADPSNPKTGDAGILMPLISMFSSAAAAAYVIGKKRR